jgi:hypothetical protein
MTKIHWTLFAIALVMIGAAAGFLFKVKGHQKLGAPGVKLCNEPLFDEKTNRVADVTVALPENVLAYLSQPVPVSDQELSRFPKDTTLGKRRYSITNIPPVDLTVVLMGQDRTSLHKPEFCLVGQGWTIDETEMVNIPLQRPRTYDLAAMKMISSIRVKDEAGNPMMVRGVYIYWFVADGKLTPSHDKRMWSMAKGLLRTGVLERWAYVSYFSSCLPGHEEETFNRMKEFIAASVPEFQLATGKPLGAASQTTVQTAFKQAMFSDKIRTEN